MNCLKEKSSDQFGITAYLDAKADSAVRARPKPWGC